MNLEPVPRELYHLLERSRLFEEVRGPGDDLETGLAAQRSLRPPVDLDYERIRSADDQKRGRSHGCQLRTGEIGTSAARDHGGHPRRAARSTVHADA